MKLTPDRKLTREEAAAAVAQFEAEHPEFAAFRARWSAFMAGRRAAGAYCDTPGQPGSHPQCGSCTASCSSDPADVDPAEAAALADGIHPYASEEG